MIELWKEVKNKRGVCGGGERKREWEKEAAEREMKEGRQDERRCEKREREGGGILGENGGKR